MVILFSPGFFPPCLQPRADLTWLLCGGRCTLIAEFPPSVCPFFSPSLTLTDPPMITDMKNTPAHLGKTAILRCEAMAVPPAAFEWYRDDHRWDAREFSAHFFGHVHVKSAKKDSIRYSLKYADFLPTTSEIDSVSPALILYVNI